MIESAPTFTPGELAAFLGILAFLASLVLALKKIFGHEPPLHKEYATRDQHAELKKEIEKLDNERRVSTAKLHEKVEEQRDRLARVEEKTDSQTRHLFALDTKIENLPEKIARLLKS